MVDTEITVPRNMEAERALLGACMQARSCYEDARAIVHAEDFWSPAHEKIWRHIEGVADSGSVLDPMSVMQSLSKTGELAHVGTASYLHDLIANPFIGVNVGYQARAVHESARARRALQIHQRIGQVLAEKADDHEGMLHQLARQAIDLELLVDERTGTDSIEGFSTWDQFFDKPRGAAGSNWLIPGLIRRQDVMMLLAGEGGGKTYFTRQFVMTASAGMHPFRPSRFQRPLNTLHIDLENPDDLIAEEGHGIVSQVKALGAWKPEHAFIWHRPQGLNLRDRKDAMLLERAVAESDAELVTLGSLYKAFSRRGDSWDQAAEETREVFDRIRARYGCAFIIEHHMPKGDGGASYDRPQSPFGSQQWIGWASMGFIINRVGDNMYRLDTFRGTRGEREFPVGLTRGGELPWSPVWDLEELKYGMWPELKDKKPHR